MEKTPKYQLSQWKEEDRIRREDLNQDNINLESALVGMESRKLELIKVFDITKQLSDSPPWDISLTEMDPKSRTAIFLMFQMPDSTSYGIGLGGGHNGYIYGNTAGLMGWPLRIPEMRVTLIPIGNASEFTSRTGLTYKDFTYVRLYGPSTNSKLTGTFRCKGYVIL